MYVCMRSGYIYGGSVPPVDDVCFGLFLEVEGGILNEGWWLAVILVIVGVVWVFRENNFYECFVWRNDVEFTYSCFYIENFLLCYMKFLYFDIKGNPF